MNIKKRLDHEAKLTHQKILEDSDQKLLSSINSQIHETKRSTFFHHWKIWLTGAACTISAVLIIVCTMLLVPSGEHVIYYEKNFESSASDATALNIDLKDFQVCFGENVIAKNLQRTIDGPSGDLLYYEMTLQTTDRRIQTSLTIICNQNFIYNINLPPNMSYQQGQLHGYPMTYSIAPVSDPNLQYIILQAHAKIEGEKNIIFITDYQEVSLNENGSFFEFIQDLIQVKE